MEIESLWTWLRSRAHFRTAAVLGVIVLLVAGFALAQAIFTPFNGESMGVGPPIPGKVTCPGGQVLSEPNGPPCSPGSRFHIRDFKFPHILRTGESRLNGSQVVTVNGNFDGFLGAIGPGSGEMWGTAVITVREGDPLNGRPTGEIWEEVWTGSRTVTGDRVQEVIDAVAHGSGGRIEGLQAKWTLILDPVRNVGVVQGRILGPGGKSPQ